MEKVIYSLSAPADASVETLTAQLSAESDQLAALGVRGCVVNVADAEVGPAAGLRITTEHAPPDAFVQVWVDTANQDRRVPVDALVSGLGEMRSAHLVTESVPLDQPLAAPAGDDAAHPARRSGFSQMACITRPGGMERAEWFEIWLNSHTQLAVDLQDTNLYVQNPIVRTLIDGPGSWDAIVEEGFTAEAMTDQEAFFDARGDADLLTQRQTEMFNSVQRFIDLSVIEVIPTSRYEVMALTSER